jgi:hypothetical protein
MRRPTRILLLVLGLLAFLAVSLGLGRVLSANGAERDAILALVAAQARGDAATMIARIDGCASRPACVATARANAARGASSSCGSTPRRASRSAARAASRASSGRRRRTRPSCSASAFTAAATSLAGCRSSCAR